MPATTLLVGLGALGTAPLVGAYAVAVRHSRRTGIQRSLAAIELTYQVASRRREGAEAGAGEPAAAVPDRPEPYGRLGALGRVITPRGGVSRLQRWIDYAGNPPAWQAERAIAAKGVGLIGGLMVGAALGLMLGGGTPLMLGALVCGLVGYFAPDLAIYNIGVKRQEELQRSLPDVLETLTIAVEAGQGFDAALAQVARNGKGPMAGETARVLQEMRMGKTRAEALRAMASRTTVVELRGFASAVIQASELGVPIGQVLREQAKEMRVRRRQRAEELAQKVPIKILFPTLFCLFPALFVVIIGPGVINIIASFKR